MTKFLLFINLLLFFFSLTTVAQTNTRVINRGIPALVKSPGKSTVGNIVNTALQPTVTIDFVSSKVTDDKFKPVLTVIRASPFLPNAPSPAVRGQSRLLALKSDASGPVINATGTISSLNTTFGTPSSSTSFNVSGTGMTGSILVTPSAGFEVSIDNLNFSSTVTVGAAGAIASTVVYVRLAATAAAISYTGNIVLSSPGAASLNITPINGVVAPKPMIVYIKYGKYYGTHLVNYTITTSTGLTFNSNNSLVNGNTVTSMSLVFNGNGTAATDPVGTYPNAVTPTGIGGENGFLASNYALTFTVGDLEILPAPLSITANSVNKPYGTTITGGAGSLAFTSSALQNSETVGTVTITYGTGSAASAASGIYKGSVTASSATGGTFAASNYAIKYLPGDITVEAATPFITAGTVSGSISACAGSASASPDIQQFSVSGNNLTGGITATAPAGFEVSLTAVSGYTGNVVIPVTPGAVTVYVRSSSTAPPGNISGNVVLSSPGAPTQNVAVTGTINALPTVNTVANQTVTGGSATTAVTFTGTGNSFTWVNDTPGIGLAENGAGDIASFKAVNTGNTPINAHITVTPVPSSGFAYIANNAVTGNDFVTPETVSVINTATNVVIATITVGVGPWGVAVSPNGSRVYVANSFSRTVSVINTSTNTVVATIPVGGAPSAITASPDGSRVYVTNSTSNSNSIAVINTATNTVLATVNLGTTPQIYPADLAVSPDSKRVYVADTPGLNGSGAGSYIAVINTSTNVVDFTIPVPSGNIGYMALSSDGSIIYLINYNNPESLLVINTATKNVTTTSVITNYISGLTISADGSTIYTLNSALNSVYVYNTISKAVTATIPVGQGTSALALTSDGKELYVQNTYDNTVSVINTATNSVIATVPVGGGPEGFGHFITAGFGCTGTPTTFTITVNPSPTIVATTPTGAITACEGSPSASPDIQQFTISGSALNNDITATAPTGFEVSLATGSGYGNSVIIPQINGAVTNKIIYVRSAASAPAGNISGNVVLTSTGATTQNIPVTGTVNAIPTVNAVANQTVINGAATTAINFTGTANTYSWLNDTPGIGLAAKGTGNIGSFTAVNMGTSLVTATITVTPVPSAGSPCTGAPITFTITVNPEPVTNLTATGALTPLNTVYGTPSATESFTIAGTNISSPILVTPPPGFEVSTDGNTFGSTASINLTGNVADIKVYIRLASTTPAGSYSGNIVLSSSGVKSLNKTMPNSVVSPAPLVIIADNKSKLYETANPALTFKFNGFVNNDNASKLTSQPEISTTANTESLPGDYPIIVTGASSSNYSISYVDGILTINAALQAIVVPNTFTPNGDGINDTWDLKNIDGYTNCQVQVFNRYGIKVFYSAGYSTPWNGSYHNSLVPPGTYYYIINPNNGQKLLSGYVAIIR